MTDIDATFSNPRPADSLVTLTHVIYALHAFTVVTGIISSAFILTAFLTGWPSILAVILNYLKRDEARGTYLESHFRWQIRTFWFALLWVAIAWLLIITLFGIPFGIAVFIIAGLWVLYRIVRGWLRLMDRQAMPSQD
ncbi:hypothetical protein SCD_n02080 [Sulfuricella denitrificans skB26]|uniref:Transmembrane protein n=1 Tax=Sulfuricella denitrificans (strain DSM 22764 / NBRC 105220 / skB26) TaxID=1163617 RepID=S6AI59_SULDS|nr:membrane protein [Sulfuricella denitrificans]BAN35891.1 hypothetical protein SCD_n02080 [Sulfuricella denitrificans skB26]